MGIYVNFFDSKHNSLNHGREVPSVSVQQTEQIKSLEQKKSVMPVQSVKEQTTYVAMSIAEENAANFKDAWSSANKYEQDGGKNLAAMKNIFEGKRNQFVNKYNGRFLEVTGEILEKEIYPDADGNQWVSYVLGRTVVDVPVEKGRKQALSEVVVTFSDEIKNKVAMKKNKGDKVRVRGTGKVIFSLNGNLTCYIEKAKVISPNDEASVKSNVKKRESMAYKLGKMFGK